MTEEHDDRRVSLTDLAAGFEPAEVDLWEGETWGGLFLTVDVTKPVQDKMTALKREANERIRALAEDDDVEADDDIDAAVDLLAKLYDALLVPAPGHGRKRAKTVILHAYENGIIGLPKLREGLKQIVDASRPT